MQDTKTKLNFQAEMLEVVEMANEVDQSDLQGMIEALANKYLPNENTSTTI